MLLATNARLDAASLRRDRWRLTDGDRDYGWISIALHWLSAIVVIGLWVVGSAVRSAPAARYGQLVDVHTTIAITAYVLMWARIIWRVKTGHPEPLPSQNKFFFSIAKVTHYLLIVALCGMLWSGPLIVWSRGNSIHVFDFSIPSPLGYMPHMSRVMPWIHRAMSWVVIWAVVLHVGGALKHAAFDQDGTLGRMLAPRR
jgi:cytochrome b561